jgi:hypothetical protein
MATWTYGPVEIDEDWDIEYKKVAYSVEYQTTADILTVLRTFEGKTDTILLLGNEQAKAVAKMMAKWLKGYEGERDFLRNWRRIKLNRKINY